MHMTTSRRLEISFATPDDDAELRALYAGSDVGGDLAIVYKREPSFFYALGAMGDESRVFVGRLGGRIIGMGCITFFKAYVQGSPHTIGYMHSLRVDPAYQKSIYLARAYQQFYRMGEDQGVPFYISTIIADNYGVVRLFQKQRPFMPRYHDMGRYTTHVIPFLRKRRQTQRLHIQGISSPEELVETINWMQEQGRRRDLFPVFDSTIVRDVWMKQYGLQDILAARAKGRIVGTLAMWDQGSFRQTVVHGYHGKWRLIKPCYNVLARALGGCLLPEENRPFKYLFASFPAAEDNNPVILRELLEALYEHAREAGYSYCVIGLHEQDPLNQALEGFFTFPYVSRLYMVTRQEKPGCELHLPYLELARL